MIGVNHGTVNLCPEHFIEDMRNIIEGNKKKEQKIEVLEKEIEYLKTLLKNKHPHKKTNKYQNLNIFLTFTPSKQRH